MPSVSSELPFLKQKHVNVNIMRWFYGLIILVVGDATRDAFVITVFVILVSEGYWRL